MNKNWNRFLRSLCLMLVAVSVLTAPAMADPGNPPVWPPVSDIVTPAADDGTVTPASSTTQTVSQ